MRQSLFVATYSYRFGDHGPTLLLFSVSSLFGSGAETSAGTTMLHLELYIICKRVMVKMSKNLVNYYYKCRRSTRKGGDGAAGAQAPPLLLYREIEISSVTLIEQSPMHFNNKNCYQI